MLVSIKDVTFGYDEKIILSGITADINEGERIGLVGKNGEGKTTLINLLLGNLIADDGSVFRKKGLTIGYLKQNTGIVSEKTVYNEMLSVYSKLIEAENRMREIESEMGELDHNSLEYRILSAEYDRCNAVFSAGDGYNIDVRIKTVLNGMGFNGRYDEEIPKMSGGEKTRLMLCRLLLIAPELLILDEPTNHLDLSALNWLEKYLEDFHGSILVVSHDRYFLDKITDHIWELENHCLTEYTGNYSKYRQLKKDYFIRRTKEYERQQKQIADMREYAERNIARASTSNSAKSRLHQLANMNVIDKPFEDNREPKFDFVTTVEPVKDVIRINHMNVGYPSRELINDVDFTLHRGERIALIGANGSGKSTFIRKIVDGSGEKTGTVIFGKNVKISYYDQENINLNPNNTVIDELWHRNHKCSQTEVRKVLARLMLYTEDIEKQIKVLSGGERAKLAFAVMIMEKGNVLILDEPTNHLDLDAREALEEGLKKFEGTILFVSHDRYFVNALSDKILEIENKRLNTYMGNYDDYLEAKKLEAALIQADKESEKLRISSDKENKSYRSSKQRANEVNNKQKLNKLETALGEAESRKTELEQLLSDNKVLSDYNKLKEVNAEYEELKKKIEELTLEWEETAMLM